MCSGNEEGSALPQLLSIWPYCSGLPNQVKLMIVSKGITPCSILLIRKDQHTGTHTGNLYLYTAKDCQKTTGLLAVMERVQLVDGRYRLVHPRREPVPNVPEEVPVRC